MTRHPVCPRRTCQPFSAQMACHARPNGIVRSRVMARTLVERILDRVDFVGSTARRPPSIREQAPMIDGVEVPRALFGDGLLAGRVIPRRVAPVREFRVGHVKPFGHTLHRDCRLLLGSLVRAHRSRRGVPARVVRLRHGLRDGSIAHRVSMQSVMLLQNDCRIRPRIDGANGRHRPRCRLLYRCNGDRTPINGIGRGVRHAAFEHMCRKAARRREREADDKPPPQRTARRMLAPPCLVVGSEILGACFCLLTRDSVRAQVEHAWPRPPAFLERATAPTVRRRHIGKRGGER